MPRFLDTTGNAVLSVGICGRCSRKFPLGMLISDGNTPGLLVCQEDFDTLDPYRLPARQTESILLPFTRPDTSIATNPQGLPTEDDSYFLTTEDSEGALLP
jgi:hypothetical protein